ncbi:MAG: PPC domain-containing protein [Bdellovibrionales bacterium]
MKNCFLTGRYRQTFTTLVFVLAVSFVLVAVPQARAQEGQGKYITEATMRLMKLADKSNADGFEMKDNLFSIGGGWLKQGKETWVALFTISLVQGKQYRFLAAGDGDAKDLDLQIVDAKGKVVAEDVATNPEAIVNFTPPATGTYVIRLRLYDSRNNLPCACLGVVLDKR